MTRRRLSEKAVEGDRRPVAGSIGRRGLLKGALAASALGAAPFNILKAGQHWSSWTRAIKGEDKAMSQFDYAGPFSEVILLGDVAITRPGRKLLWDSKNMRITNDAAANKSIFMRRLAPRDDMNWI